MKTPDESLLGTSHTYPKTKQSYEATPKKEISRQTQESGSLLQRDFTNRWSWDSPRKGESVERVKKVERKEAGAKRAGSSVFGFWG